MSPSQIRDGWKQIQQMSHQGSFFSSFQSAISFAPLTGSTAAAPSKSDATKQLPPPDNKTMSGSKKGTEESGKRKAKLSHRWNTEDTMSLLSMVHAIHQKNGCNSTFQWASIAEQFKEKTKKDLPALVVKNKFNYMKKQYTAWTRLRYDVTGAGWDEDQFKVTATEEWWERQKLEDFYPFNKAPPSREMSKMWDDLFESVVATGKNVVATSADQLELVPVTETFEGESSGGNESDFDRQNLDDDTETPLGDTQDTPPIVSKKSKKSKAYSPSFSTESIKKMRQNPGNKLFAESCGMVSSASMEFIKAIKESKNSAAGISRAEQDAEFDAAVEELNVLVELGLVAEDSRVWCYAMTELAKADRRRIFMRCSTATGKVAWLQHEYDMVVARLPR